MSRKEDKKNKPFKVSPSRRPLIQRLTPLAWALIAVGVVLVILVIVTLVLVLPGCGAEDEPWWTPSPTAPPTSTQVLPTPTATEWWESITTSTPEPSPGFPAWWADEMTQDEDGNWWAPDEVADMVREHYRAAVDAYDSRFPEGGVPDIEGMISDAPDWYSGPQLESQLRAYAAMGEGERPVSKTAWETCLLQVQEWSEDGLECTLGWVCEDGIKRVYNVEGSLEETQEMAHSPLVLWDMHYDEMDGHWKRHDLLDVIYSP